MIRSIKTVNPENKESYKKPIITFDFDWAHDDILIDTIRLVEKACINATWFVTHQTSVIDRLIQNPLFEVGIHPNFNGLMEGDFRNGRNSNEVMDKLFEIVPNAKSVRSHSLTQSSRLFQLFQQYGITHDSNDYIPAISRIKLKPWKLESGLIKVPYFWTDETSCLQRKTVSMGDLKNLGGLKVFNFHPIHVFLNTDNLMRYNTTRPIHNSPKELIKNRFKGYGVRNKLYDLININ